MDIGNDIRLKLSIIKKENRMKKIHHFEHDRRQFITKIIPACAVTCLSLGKLPELAAQTAGKNATLQDEHPFDMVFSRKLTYRQMYERKYQEFIAFAKNMETGKSPTKFSSLARSG